MKKLLLIFLFLCFSLGFSFAESSMWTFWGDDSSEVVDDSGINDPLRDWSKKFTEWVKWIEKSNIENSSQAQNKTLAFVKKIVDYFLWILGLLALIYLLYNFFLMLTAWGNEEKYNKGLQSIKYAIIAIIWIWLSWFFVSLIFYLFSKDVIWDLSFVFFF